MSGGVGEVENDVDIRIFDEVIGIARCFRNGKLPCEAFRKIRAGVATGRDDKVLLFGGKGKVGFSGDIATTDEARRAEGSSEG